MSLIPRADGAPVKVMQHLAENGPTSREDLDAFVEATGVSRATRYMALHRLREAGFIRQKVWLTPEGLAELQRLGLAPKFEGVESTEAEG